LQDQQRFQFKKTLWIFCFLSPQIAVKRKAMLYKLQHRFIIKNSKVKFQNPNLVG